MFIDSIECEEHENARLARLHPEIYDAKMKALDGWNPLDDLIDFLKSLFFKKAK